MKVGDQIPVTLAGHVVTMATVKEVADGQAVLEFVGQRVTMATRTELANEDPTPSAPEKEVIIDGVERVGETVVSETVAGESAAVAVSTNGEVTMAAVDSNVGDASNVDDAGPYAQQPSAQDGVVYNFTINVPEGVDPDVFASRVQQVLTQTDEAPAVNDTVADAVGQTTADAVKE